MTVTFSAPGGGSSAPSTGNPIAPFTALTGGGASALDGLVTVGGATPENTVAESVVSGVFYKHQLQTNTGAQTESSPARILPDDAHAVTNNMIWIRVLLLMLSLFLAGFASAQTTPTEAVRKTDVAGDGGVLTEGFHLGTGNTIVLDSGSTFTFSGTSTGTISGVAFNGTIGGTTPAAGTFTTLTAGSTTSLLLGTAGSAVGNIGFRNATSGTATLAPPTGALGTYTVTLPGVASTLATLGENTFTGAQTLSAGLNTFTLTPVTGGNAITFVKNGTTIFSFSEVTGVLTTYGGFIAPAGGISGLSYTVSAAGTISWTTDLVVQREAANHLSIRYSTNASILSIANTWTSTTNYERFKIDWQSTANVCRIGTSKGSGGGTARDMTLEWGDAEKARITTGGLQIGSSGSAIASVLRASATLDFPSTGAGAVADLTITVTGAVDGDQVVLGVPNASITSTATFTAWVSAADTVTVRFSPKATEDPASGTFKVSVIK